MAVPYTFATATTTLPLSQLDANFAYFGNAITVSAGNVGIGVTTPAQKLQIGTSSANDYIQFGATNLGFVIGRENSSGDFLFNATQASPYNIFKWQQAGTERMRIDSSGNLLVGTTASVGNNNKVAIDFDKNSLNGLSFRQLVSDAGGGQPVLFNNVAGTGIGSITSGSSSVAYNTSSDHRLKNSVAPIISGLATITALKPVTYKWNVDNSDGEGFIAHELQEFVPLAVVGEKDAVNKDGSIKPQGVDYSKIVVHLVAAIQELEARLAALEAK